MEAPTLWGKLLVLSCLCLTACQKEPITVYTVPKEIPITFQSAPSALHWVAPSTWKSQPASAMRLASFQIPAKSGSCELSIVALSGEAGGFLANINRWRGQLKLAPISGSDLKSATSSKKLGHFSYTVVNLVDQSHQKGILAAILTTKETSYFFKLTGSPSDIQETQTGLYDFLSKVTLSE